MQDELQTALRDLASRVNISTVESGSGGMNVSFGSGRPLVLGSQASSLDVTSEPPSGYAAIRSGGTVVTADTPVFELDTDKISTEVPAGAAGAVKFKVQEGDTVKVGGVVAEIDTRVSPAFCVTWLADPANAGAPL